MFTELTLYIEQSCEREVLFKQQHRGITRSGSGFANMQELILRKKLDKHLPLDAYDKDTLDALVTAAMMKSPAYEPFLKRLTRLKQIDADPAKVLQWQQQKEQGLKPGRQAAAEGDNEGGLAGAAAETEEKNQKLMGFAGMNEEQISEHSVTDVDLPADEEKERSALNGLAAMKAANGGELPPPELPPISHVDLDDPAVDSVGGKLLLKKWLFDPVVSWRKTMFNHSQDPKWEEWGSQQGAQPRIHEVVVPPLLEETENTFLYFVPSKMLKADEPAIQMDAFFDKSKDVASSPAPSAFQPICGNFDSQKLRVLELRLDSQHDKATENHDQRVSQGELGMPSLHERIVIAVNATGNDECFCNGVTPAHTLGPVGSSGCSGAAAVPEITPLYTRNEQKKLANEAQKQFAGIAAGSVFRRVPVLFMEIGFPEQRERGAVRYGGEEGARARPSCSSWPVSSGSRSGERTTSSWLGGAIGPSRRERKISSFLERGKGDSEFSLPTPSELEQVFRGAFAEDRRARAAEANRLNEEADMVAGIIANGEELVAADARAAAQGARSTSGGPKDSFLEVGSPFLPEDGSTSTCVGGRGGGFSWIGGLWEGLAAHARNFCTTGMSGSSVDAARQGGTGRGARLARSRTLFADAPPAPVGAAATPPVAPVGAPAVPTTPSGTMPPPSTTPGVDPAAPGGPAPASTPGGPPAPETLTRPLADHKLLNQSTPEEKDASPSQTEIVDKDGPPPDLGVSPEQATAAGETPGWETLVGPVNVHSGYIHRGKATQAVGEMSKEGDQYADGSMPKMDSEGNPVLKEGGGMDENAQIFTPEMIEQAREKKWIAPEPPVG